jgi:hypothetical protein
MNIESPLLFSSKKKEASPGRSFFDAAFSRMQFALEVPTLTPTYE